MKKVQAFRLMALLAGSAISFALAVFLIPPCLTWIQLSGYRLPALFRNSSLARKLFNEKQFKEFLEELDRASGESFPTEWDFNAAVMVSKRLFIPTEMYGRMKYRYRPDIEIFNSVLWNGMNCQAFAVAGTNELLEKIRKNFVVKHVSFKTDGDGFKGTSFHWTPGTPALLFLGDSFTEGSWNDPRDTFVNLFGEKMKAAGINACPINLGVNGYGVLEMRWMLEHFAPKFRPWDRDFYLGTGWNEWKNPKIIDYPIVRFLVEQGYVYFQENLPDDADRPFISYFHPCDLHYPYDLYRRRERQLLGVQKKIYRRLLAGIDEIVLVKEPADTEKFPALMEYQAFGVWRTELLIEDAAQWNSLLKSLKETGRSPAALIAASLPSRLTRRLAQIQTAEQLTLRDKKAIIRALNGLTRNTDSPIGQVLFGPRSFFNEGDMVVGDVISTRWDWLFVADIERCLMSPNPMLKAGNDGRLFLLEPLNKNQRLLLRKIYRETLESILPALTLHHPQHFYIEPQPEVLQSWRNSPGYENDLALFRYLYDADISDVDQRFGEYLEQLRRLGVLDKTIVVFMGDHGESFMEHGYLEHGMAKCYDEEINPPLLIRVPGRLTKPVTIDTQLRIADVLPTLVELMGLRGPAPSGTSLASALAGGPQPDITAISRNYSTSRSIRRNDGWKLIWEMGTNQRELYNWKTDPKENHNVAADFPQITAELEEKLKQFLYGD